MHTHVFPLLRMSGYMYEGTNVVLDKTAGSHPIHPLCSSRGSFFPTGKLRCLKEAVVMLGNSDPWPQEKIQKENLTSPKTKRKHSTPPAEGWG